MSITRFLELNAVHYRVYHHSETYDAQHMAQSLHISGKMIAKAVMVRTCIGSEFLVVVVPGTRLVDLKRVAAVLGADVQLANEAEILAHCPGCEFGVVPIFGSQYGLDTIVDELVSKEDEIVFQGDTHEEAVRMRFADYYAVEHPRIASIVQARQHPELAS